ncbi:antirestriction protein ArdA [Enterococcus casseliflavus]|uniref:antirestriction protein ArdA n=1 Tax=Enterococcus casseliflavus TaxID=37734 RepID=UPI003D6BDAEC
MAASRCVYGRCGTYYVEEAGTFGGVPSHLQNCIDYQALKRDVELEGSFLITSHEVFECIN